VIEN
jgi:hypothetical protein